MKYLLILFPMVLGQCLTDDWCRNTTCPDDTKECNVATGGCECVDELCDEGFACVDGECASGCAGAGGSPACADGFGCQGGTCVVGLCNDLDCVGGYACTDGNTRCATYCFGLGQCRAGYACENGGCAPVPAQ